MIVPVGYVALSEISVEFAKDFSRIVPQGKSFFCRYLVILDWIKQTKIEIFLCSDTGDLCPVSHSIFWCFLWGETGPVDDESFLISLNSAFMTLPIDKVLKKTSNRMAEIKALGGLWKYSCGLDGVSSQEFEAVMLPNVVTWHVSRPNNHVVISRDDAAGLRAHISGLVKKAMAKQSKPGLYPAAHAKRKMFELMDVEPKPTKAVIFAGVKKAFPKISQNRLNKIKREIENEHPNLIRGNGRPPKNKG